MRRAIRIISGAIVVGAVGYWLVAGANRGWTRTSVPKKMIDDVTGIEGVTYEKRFVPGLDFLGAAVLGAGTLAGISFLVRSKKLTN